MTGNGVVVGFIGLGIMGGRMAANLQKAGYKLVVHDLHRQAASHHLNAGAAWADNPRAVADRTDVIFSSLLEPPDVESVALGPDRVIAGMKPGTAYFDLPHIVSFGVVSLSKSLRRLRGIPPRRRGVCV